MTVPLILILLAASITSASQENQPINENTQRVAVPQPSPEAIEYYRSGNLLWVVSQTTSLAIPAVVLLTGLSIRIRNLARRIGRKWYFVVLGYIFVYCLLTFTIQLPLAFYTGFVRQHAYGLSNQTLLKWLSNFLKARTLELGCAVLVLWVPYLLMARSPRRWWLYTAILALPAMFFVAFVTPIWVDPLFNDFGPMINKQLEAEILALANEAGIENGRVFEVNMSADTKALNAYVTGLGSSKRIVLWDTLLAKLTPREVRVVMAHEMGHYVLNHVMWGLSAAFVGIVVALFLVDRAATFLLGRYSCRLGFDQLSDIASLPLMVLLAHLVVFLMMPVGLAVSRHMEHEADRFALELTHDNHAAATAFARFQTENLSYPNPGLLYTLLRATHPSLAERIEFSNDYRPWDTGVAKHGP